MPVGLLTIVIASLVYWFFWWLLHRRIKTSETTPSKQVLLMREFFLLTALFVTFLTLPQMWILINPAQFPLVMAIGYTIGIIFQFISFITLIRLIFSLLPSLSSWWKRISVSVGILAGTGLAIANIFTMVFGVRPEFHMETSTTILNINPSLGLSITIFAVLTTLPAATLFIMNGVRNASARVRSFLLGGGFIVVTIAGGLFNNTNDIAIYLLGCALALAGTIFLLAGLLYRFEERFAMAKQTSKQKESTLSA